MTASIKELSRVVLASKVLADAAQAEGNAAREELAAQMADTGAERLRVTDDTGVDYGTVIVTAGRLSAYVADEDAFVAWVAKRYPDEMVTTVRPGFRERLLSTAKKLGDPVDPQTGEVIPGLEVQPGSSYLQTRPSSEARDRMRAALVAHGLLMLGAAPAEQAVA